MRLRTMRRRTMRLPLLVLCSTLCLFPPAPTLAQNAADDSLGAVVQVGSGYNVKANVTYLTASGRDLKLDVYQPSPATSAVPVVINFHGGGWVAGSREGSLLKLLPYMNMGVAVVNVEYRLGKTALAPAAVEDTL